MIASYTSNMRLKAKLKKQIKLDNGTVFKKGTVSELLIAKENNTYHFEAKNQACTVDKQELEFL